MKFVRLCFVTVSLAFVASAVGCADDFGGMVTPAEALRRQQDAGNARATALMCTMPAFSQTATGTQCSLADVTTCVNRITAAATCDGINAAYLACPVRCR